MAGFYLFSHPSIIYRVWLITPNTLSSSLSTTDPPESCTLWHTFAIQVWTPKTEKNCIFLTSRFCFERNRSTCSCSIYAHLYLWKRFEVQLVFWLELTDFLSCIVSFNFLWCSFKEVNSNSQSRVSVFNLLYSNRQLLFCCVFVFCFVKWDWYWATNTLNHRMMYSQHM